MSYDWDKHWERVSAAYVAEFGIPWLNIPPHSVQPTEPNQAKADVRDAQRYRWLREQSWLTIDTVVAGHLNDPAGVDAAIDAAMQRELDAHMTEYKPGEIANNN